MKRLAAALSILAALNFFAFFFSCLYLGGDALNGHAAGGHFYLAWHGTLTEVSESTFNFNRIHAFVTIGLMALTVLVSLFFKPSDAHSKWMSRVIAGLIVLSAILAVAKYGF